MERWQDELWQYFQIWEPIYTVSCAWHKFANALRASLEAFSVGPLALNALNTLNPSYHSNGSFSWFQVAPVGFPPHIAVSLQSFERGWLWSSTLSRFTRPPVVPLELNLDEPGHMLYILVNRLKPKLSLLRTHPDRTVIIDLSSRLTLYSNNQLRQ
jgi:hypothetical protein